MRTSKFSILLLLLLFPLLSNAQYSGFDLSRYTLPDIKLNRLDVNMNMSNNGYSDHHKTYYSDSTETSSNDFQGMLNLDFYHFRNTEKYQGSFRITANAHLQPRNSKSNDYKQNYNSFQGNFLITNINRLYNQNLNFIEIDPVLSLTSDIYKSEYENANNFYYIQDQKRNNLTTSISVPVSLGHGRIEPVEDLRLAIYILEELNKIGRINNLPEDAVVLSMAKEISKIKRERFFDSRLKKIREMQVIDSFLVANNIVKSNDINYFAVLNDQWDFASGPARFAGFSVNGGIDDYLRFNRSLDESTLNSDTTEKTESHVNTSGISAFFKTMYYKPINLYWQTSLIFNTHWGYEFTKDPKDENDAINNYTTTFFSSSLEYSIQYLPDSRTSITFSLSSSYINSKGDRTIPISDPVIFQMKGNYFNIRAGFNMYYYVSPQLRIQLDSNLSYHKQNEIYSNDSESELKNFANSLQHNFELKLVYSFF